ncbi:hypothetical protein ABI_28750 [Asticcacaulis biprosthecium C19]|uniref:Uncharacterized protein n=2 Tax=Asticcacaulis biprosthecium TaxID=76891 RepID=F4QML7_9CAUL|nr:hypothetical protein ABI_28750 [Asticcacaulis biprosthecium C19]
MLMTRSFTGLGITDINLTIFGFDRHGTATATTPCLTLSGVGSVNNRLVKQDLSDYIFI